MYEPVGLESVLAGREDQFPILTRALANVEQAASTTIEWTHKDGPTWKNFTQIFRTAFGVTHTATASAWYAGDMWEKLREKYLLEHLLDIEKTLDHGRLHQEIRYAIGPETGELYSLKYDFMGGVRFYLGRPLEDDDFVALHILRGTEFRDLTGPDVDGREGEFLTELTLVVGRPTFPKERLAA